MKMKFWSIHVLVELTTVVNLNFFIQISSSDFPCIYKAALKGELTSRELGVRSVIQTKLRRGEKVCYELNIGDKKKLEKKDQQVRNETKTGQNQQRRILTIGLKDVWQEYQVSKVYNFTIPSLRPACSCECPQPARDCSKKYEDSTVCPEEFKNHRHFCVRKFFPGVKPDGCFFSLHLANLCCTLTFYSTTSLIYHALYLDSPITYYVLEIIFQDGNGRVLNRNPSVLVSSNSGNLNQGNYSIELSGHAVMRLLSSQWIYVESGGNFTAMGGVRINDVEETDLTKLGWYKFTKVGNLFPVDNVVLRNAFDVQLNHCSDDEYKWKFAAVGWENRREMETVGLGEPLTEIYKSSVDKAVFDKMYRVVKIYPKGTSPITVVVTIDYSLDLILKDDDSRLDNFVGIVVVDQFSNRILHLSLVKASAKLSVTVGSGEETEHFSIVVPSSKPINHVASIRLNSNFVGRQKVCITPLKQIPLCKYVNYTEIYSPGPNLPNKDFLPGIDRAC